MVVEASPSVMNGSKIGNLSLSGLRRTVSNQNVRLTELIMRDPTRLRIVDGLTEKLSREIHGKTLQIMKKEVEFVQCVRLRNRYLVFIEVSKKEHMGFNLDAKNVMFFIKENIVKENRGINLK